MGLAVAMALVAGAFGIGGALQGGFEARAAEDIASRLGGDDPQVTVTIEPNGIAGIWGDVTRATISASDFTLQELPLYTEPDRSQSGRLQELILDLRDFRLRGLDCEELFARIPGNRYDFGLARNQGQIRLSRSGSGEGYVRVREEALARFIVSKFAEIREATVRVYNDVIWVEGVGEFLLLRTSFTVIANLISPDGSTLELDNARIYFNWQRADEFAAQALLQTLNPVVDFDRDLGLAGAIRVERIRLRDGVLEAGGRTQIPERPERNGSS